MIPKLEDCNPGLSPVGYNVLVALDVIEEKIGSIIIPTKHAERENSASERGRIVGVSPMAFKGGDWEGVETPERGVEVLFQRYAGTEFDGADGKKYRLVADTDLKGIFQ